MVIFQLETEDGAYYYAVEQSDDRATLERFVVHALTSTLGFQTAEVVNVDAAKPATPVDTLADGEPYRVTVDWWPIAFGEIF